MPAARAEAAAPPAPGWAPPAWAWPLSLVCSLAGLGVAAYLTAVHYSTHVTLACSATGLINCERVTTSPQAEVAGVPVAVLGVAWFAVMGALGTPRAWRSDAAAIRFARVAWVVAGVAMVLHLLYAELFQIDAICLWCSAAHLLVGLLFAIVLLGTALARTAG